MIEELTSLEKFLDLGGVFILALVLLYVGSKKLDLIESQISKILALLTILVKTQTNFNGVEGVLGKDGDKVADIILKAEQEETKSS